MDILRRATEALATEKGKLALASALVIEKTAALGLIESERTSQLLEASEGNAAARKAVSEADVRLARVRQELADAQSITAARRERVAAAEVALTKAAEEARVEVVEALATQVALERAALAKQLGPVVATMKRLDAASTRLATEGRQRVQSAEAWTVSLLVGAEVVDSRFINADRRLLVCEDGTTLA